MATILGKEDFTSCMIVEKEKDDILFFQNMKIERHILSTPDSSISYFIKIKVGS